MTEIREYYRVHSIEEHFERSQSCNSPVKVLCGGTDLFLKLPRGNQPDVSLIDISEISELSGIERTSSGIRIGAVTKLEDIATSNLFIDAEKILAYGASQVGSRQIRNLASIGGNVCNAAPSADTSAPLLALDAKVEILSQQGVRQVLVSEFFVGPGQTILSEKEVCSAIFIPKQPKNSTGVYIKHCVRGAMELALVGVAVVLWKSGSKLDARIALSAVAPTPFRVFNAEEMVRSLDELNEENVQAVGNLAVQASKPISDVRASAEYRQAMIRKITKRALLQAYKQLQYQQE